MVDTRNTHGKPVKKANQKFTGEVAQDGKMTCTRMYTASSAPGVTHDGYDSAGIAKIFEVGDLWNDTATLITYKCVDNTKGAASWPEFDVSAHAASDGSSHTFIDQDVTVAASPTHNTLSLTATLLGPKFKITPEGGYAVLLTNKTGGTSVKGYLVEASSTTDNAVAYTSDEDIDCFGVIYNAVAADAEVWVVIAGIADVYYGGDVTRATFSRVPVAADGGSYSTQGWAINEALPTSPFSTDKHFAEIGHPLESRTGAGLAKTILHFN